MPRQLELNHWALGGEWSLGRESAVLAALPARIAYRFHARDLHVVMGPAVRGATARFRVTIDGHPPASAHGVDVDEDGNGTVREPRMYQLIRQQKPIVDRDFVIEFIEGSAEAFSFTFG